MKYLLGFLLMISFSKVQSQQIAKLDTIYYLVDTAHTPQKERMWNIFIESDIKCFEIECPCLQYDNKPTFTYKITNLKQLISGKKFENINTVNITTLIKLAKGDIRELHTYPVLVFVEKQDDTYIMHRVVLLEPRKPVVIIDSVRIQGK